MAGTFIKHIERARAAAQTTRPAEKNISEMTQEELDEAMRQAKLEVIAADRAYAAAVSEESSKPAGTLGAKLAELQRGKRKTWR